jgi:hypothetical protein
LPIPGKLITLSNSLEANMRSLLLALGFVFVIAAPALAGAPAAPAWANKKNFCGSACNKVSCKLKAFKDICNAVCEKSSVKNCLAAQEIGNDNKDYKKFMGTFCGSGCNKLTCTHGDVKNVCGASCPHEKVPNCLAARELVPASMTHAEETPAEKPAE